MKRTDRLFEILQLFRETGFLRASDIAERLEVSVRTIYRDLDTLAASGHPIEGERGVGYLLREPIFLPPLSFTPDEAAVLRLGMDLVRTVSDTRMAETADAVLRKLSPMPRPSGVSVYAATRPAPAVHHISMLRDAVERRHRILLRYSSLKGVESERTVRPLQLEYWRIVWTLTAWCERQSDFRTFRVDRLRSVEILGDTFPAEPDKSYEVYLRRAGGQTPE